MAPAGGRSPASRRATVPAAWTWTGRRSRTGRGACASWSPTPRATSRSAPATPPSPERAARRLPVFARRASTSPSRAPVGSGGATGWSLVRRLDAGGRMRMTGRLVDAAGRAIVGVEVQARGYRGEIIARGLTRAGGTFAIQGRPLAGSPLRIGVFSLGGVLPTRPVVDVRVEVRPRVALVRDPDHRRRPRSGDLLRASRRPRRSDLAHPLGEGGGSRVARPDASHVAPGRQCPASPRRHLRRARGASAWPGSRSPFAWWCRRRSGGLSWVRARAWSGSGSSG